MCLAVPGRVISVNDCGLKMATVDFCGVRRDVCVDMVDVVPGQYLIAHAGVAISVMDEAEALATIADLEAMTRYRDSIEGHDDTH